MKKGDLVRHKGVSKEVGIFLRKLTPSHLSYRKDAEICEFFISGKLRFLSLRSFVICH